MSHTNVHDAQEGCLCHKHATPFVLLVLCVLFFSLFTFHPSRSFAGCDHTVSNTTFQDANGAIHTTTDNYYRGEILTFDTNVGICKITAYLSAADGNTTTSMYTLKLWSVSEDDNLTSVLGTSIDVYQGGNWTLQGDDNWTRTMKVFHFTDAVTVNAGRVAVTISDNNGTAHPAHHHVWNRGPAQTGHESCSWTSTGGGNCTSEASQMMEIRYIETPFLAADGCSGYEDPYHCGWIEIPEWGGNCAIEDNITIACEVPETLADGNHRLTARTCPPDDNKTHCTTWTSFHFRKISGSYQSHTAGESTAGTTGSYR